MQKNTKNGLTASSFSFLHRATLYGVVTGLVLSACGSTESSEDGPESIEATSTNEFTTNTCDQAEFEVQCETLRLLNLEREEEGLPPFVLEGSLSSAAQDHADDMDSEGYFDHVSKDGRTFSDRSIEAGYNGLPTAENIAAGAMTPAQVVEMWMGSNGHRANILSDKSNEIGVGYAPASNKWVLKFGKG